MPLYDVQILPRVTKELERIPAAERLKIGRAIYALRDNPRPTNCKKLRNREGWRIRIGDYRVLYIVKDRTLVVVVFQVGHRRDVYD